MGAAVSLEDAITDLAAAVREMAEAMRAPKELPWSLHIPSPERPMTLQEAAGRQSQQNARAVEADGTSSPPEPVGTPLPDSWLQNFAHSEIAERRRLSLQYEADAFRAACKQEGRRSTDWNAEFTAWLQGGRRVPRPAPSPPIAPAETTTDAADFDLCQQARSGKFGKRIQTRAEGGARPEVIRGMVLDREEKAANRKAAKTAE